MKRNIYFLLILGSCLATVDATAMFIRRLARKNMHSSLSRRFMNIDVNDSVKKYSFSKIADARNYEGNTPLHIGILNYAKNDGEVGLKDATVYALLGGLPNPFIENKNGETPLQLGKKLEEAGNSQISTILCFLEKYEQAYYSDVHSALNEEKN